MRQYYKTFFTMIVFLLIFIAVPQVVRAEATTTLSAYAKEGYTHLEWNVTVDTQVYHLSSFKIYRGLNAGFNVDDSSLMLAVYDPASRYFDDYDSVSKRTYYYVVKPVDTNFGELTISNVAYLQNQNLVKQPHGFYDDKTTKCGVCHSTHAGKAPGMINTELASMEDLCKICHEDGGESSMIIQHSEKLAFMKNCNQCHNPHGNNSEQKFVPMLLQVTIGGKVYFEANNLENGVGNGFCMVSECHVKYPDFKYEPPTVGKAHDSVAMVLNSTTGITCSGCHDLHGSDLPKTCLSCHEEQNDAWQGKSVYEAAYNVHSSTACNECHDPHGNGNREDYLKNNYAFDIQTNASIEENFKVCFNSCHDVNSLSQLHVSHLENQEDSTKRALCRDCHRPHGVNLEENPDKVMNIGFQSADDTSTYLKAYDYATPRYINQPIDFNTRNGACNLICHGVRHSEINEGDGVYSVYQSEAVSVNQDVYNNETETVPVTVYEPFNETLNETVYETVY